MFLKIMWKLIKKNIQSYVPLLGKNLILNLIGFGKIKITITLENINSMV